VPKQLDEPGAAQEEEQQQAEQQEQPLPLLEQPAAEQLPAPLPGAALPAAAASSADISWSGLSSHPVQVGGLRRLHLACWHAGKPAAAIAAPPASPHKRSCALLAALVCSTRRHAPLQYITPDTSLSSVEAAMSGELRRSMLEAAAQRGADLDVVPEQPVEGSYEMTSPR
jgi:hypothetical protein